MSNPIRKVSLRRDQYRDSGSLMRLTRALEGEPGITRAAAIMATARNLELLFKLGFATESDLPDPKPADLAIVVEAETLESAESALAAVDRLLAGGGAKREQGQRRPRSLEAAAQEAATGGGARANLALISVPGPFAAREARKALDQGLNVFLFSNGVSLQDELRLKQQAQEIGRIVMGPDCGTAIVDGVALGFANRVPAGPVSVVGASGTGIQEACCLLAHAGVGVGHAIGIGGRDLSAEIGGLSAESALAKLGEDAGTRMLFLISKPPAEAVAKSVLGAARATGKAVVACFLGAEDGVTDGTPVFGTLEGAVLGALRMLRHQVPEPKLAERPAPPARLVGLFTGGSLAYESLVLMKRAGISARSNLVAGSDPALASPDHTLLDLGEDDYTRGRPHPMIDPGVRAQFLSELATVDQLDTLLLDFVLGTASHADPVGALLGALKDLIAARSAKQSPLRVVASVTGTSADMQDRHRQIALLRDASVIVCRSNADATRVALGHPPSDEFQLAPGSAGARGGEALFGAALNSVNLGLDSFADELERQNTPVVRVDYRPPAGGDERLVRLLEALS